MATRPPPGARLNGAGVPVKHVDGDKITEHSSFVHPAIAVPREGGCGMEGRGTEKRCRGRSGYKRVRPSTTAQVKPQVLSRATR